jgi:hypothetical protein
MNIARAAVTRGRVAGLAGAGLAAGLLVTACSGSSGSPTASPSNAASPLASATASSGPGASAPAGTSPVATESAPPGDIPDSTVYVAYRPASGQYEMKVPEAWARTVTSSAVSFADKLNMITVQTAPAAAPTVASARASEVPKISSAVQGFTLTDVSTVTRSAGSVILIRYTADSQPDPVTGKVYKDAVERYEFYRNGTEAVLILSGPSGADNVDPWRTVTNSFRWLR